MLNPGLERRTVLPWLAALLSAAGLWWWAYGHLKAIADTGLVLLGLSRQPE